MGMALKMSRKAENVIVLNFKSPQTVCFQTEITGVSAQTGGCALPVWLKRTQGNERHL